MDKQTSKMPNKEPSSSKNSKKQLLLPIIALVLDILPIAIVLSSLFHSLTSYEIMFALLSPVAGLICAAASLSKGKGAMGTCTKALAIIALVLPLLLIALLLLFFIGATTGILSFM